MNAPDIMRYGHVTVLGTLEQVPVDLANEPGACGAWSVKDIAAHLGSYECVLVDILSEVLGEGPAPVLDRFREQGTAFNDAEVEARADRTLAGVLGELSATHASALDLLARFEPEFLRRPGTIAWYGPDYALDDLFVYMYYGHKREHAAQIDAFRDRMRAKR
jgi:hypothetical protein